MRLVGKYLIALAVFLVIDLVWLGVVAREFYAEQIGHLLKAPNWAAAFLFYLLYIGGLMYLILLPNQEKSERWLFGRGAVFGLVAYGAYDLTNLAVLEGWPVLVTVVDMVWGGVLTGSVAFLSVWAWRRFGLVQGETGNG